MYYILCEIIMFILPTELWQFLSMIFHFVLHRKNIPNSPIGVGRAHDKAHKKKKSSNGPPLWVSLTLFFIYWIFGMTKKVKNKKKKRKIYKKKISRHYKRYWGRTKEEKQARYNRALKARLLFNLQKEQNQSKSSVHHYRLKRFFPLHSWVIHNRLLVIYILILWLSFILTPVAAMDDGNKSIPHGNCGGGFDGLSILAAAAAGMTINRDQIEEVFISCFDSLNKSLTFFKSCGLGDT